MRLPLGLCSPMVVFACLVVALPAQSSSVAPVDDTALARAVEPLLRAAIEEQRIPGLSCAIAVGDRIAYAAGFGLADVENDVPATADTVYRLASISKPITAVLAMQLVEQGRLDLDQDVHEIVAEWPHKPWPVTTRLLLGHLGGVRHYDRAREATESTVRYASQTEALGLFAADPLRHEPGTKYLYSTFGFNLVAAVVEAKTGQPFAQVVRERIAGPCGAPTLQDDDVRRIIRGRAQGYVRRGDVLENSRLMDGSYKLGGGGLCSSAPDLARFAIALMHGRLVKPESLQVLWTEQRTKGGEATGYGLGFGVSSHNGQRIVAHSGAQSRVATMLHMRPEQRVAVVLLCNLEGTKLGPLAGRIADAALAVEGGR